MGTGRAVCSELEEAVEAVAVEEGEDVLDDGDRLRKVTSGASIQNRQVSKSSLHCVMVRGNGTSFSAA